MIPAGYEAEKKTDHAEQTVVGKENQTCEAESTEQIRVGKENWANVICEQDDRSYVEEQETELGQTEEESLKENHIVSEIDEPDTVEDGMIIEDDRNGYYSILSVEKRTVE